MEEEIPFGTCPAPSSLWQALCSTSRLYVPWTPEKQQDRPELTVLFLQDVATPFTPFVDVRELGRTGDVGGAHAPVRVYYIRVP